MKPLSALISTALLGSATVAAAQEAADLEPLVITGTRMEQPITETGSTVYVITREELERHRFDFLVDALARVPGVTINQNGAFGGQSSVRIRGAASTQTLVLVDGVPVNDPSSPGGGFNFARLDPENVERVEILMGPQSTLWGTDAIGGVVSITTRRPGAGFEGDVFAEYGSFNTLRAGASLSVGGEGGDFRIGINGIDSDGISKADEDNGNSEDDAYDSLSLNAAGGLNFGAAGRLDVSLLYTEADTEFDSFVFGDQGNVGDGDELSETEELTANLRYRVDALGGRLSNLFMIGYSDIDRSNFSDGQPSFSATGERWIYRYQGNFELTEQHRLTFGAERDDTEANGEDVAIDGLFGVYEYRPTDAFTLTAGLRRDDHDVYGSETTGRVGAAYNPNGQVTLRGSWGEGFKAPTLFQTTFFCCGAEAPNPNLLPEISEGFDLGVDYRTADGRGQVSLTWFDIETENQIDFSFALGGYENISIAESSGIEISGRYEATDWLALTADYAYVDAEDGAGSPLVRVPENTADVGLDFVPDGPFSGTLLVRYNDSEPDPNGEVDSWVRVDLSARYTLSRNAEIFGRIENLLDEDYQQILGYGTPDLSGYLGFRYRF
ncbi:MAG: TonB-dependent receptor [Pseudomonadota bacterium]